MPRQEGAAPQQPRGLWLVERNLLALKLLDRSFRVGLLRGSPRWMQLGRPGRCAPPSSSARAAYMLLQRALILF